MYNDSLTDKSIHESGLHPFMELEERTDLLTMSSQDPLENIIVITLEDQSLRMKENEIFADKPSLQIGAQIPQPDASKRGNEISGISLDEKFHSEIILNDIILSDTSNDESKQNGCKSHMDVNNTNEIADKNESVPKVKLKRTKLKKKRKSGTTPSVESKKKKSETRALKCQICDVQKDSLKELNKHFSEHVRKSDNKFECTFCDDEISTYENYVKHLKTHKKSKEKKMAKCFKCEICDKLFQFRCLLNDHKNLHTGYRPYLCSNCGKAFSLKASLKQHSRIHGTVKKHKCVYCEFSVYVKADLIKHIRTHTGERPYICEICGEGYIQSSHLVVHKRSHYGERPFKCDVCNRGFTKKGDVIRHRRIHTGELPYLCQVCGKAFRQSTQCSNHVKHHHPGTVNGKINIPGFIPNERDCVMNVINEVSNK